MEPLTATAIATLAFTKCFETTIEKLTEAALSKMDELRQKIWKKLRGNPNAENALVAVEQGSKADLDKVAAYLQVALTEDDHFKQEVEQLAKEIHQEISIGKVQGQNVQNVFGGEGQQFNSVSSNAPTIQGGSSHSVTINYNQPSS